jgi:hypothetical protein
MGHRIFTIDPTCGSGHFVLGGFRRLLALWEKERPDLSGKERAVKALDGVFGVDINPFAVAIARFRLLLAAWRYCGVKRLRSAPDFKVNLAVGDSLLHGARFDAEGNPYTIDREGLFGGDELVFKDETAHHFEVEDAKELHRILGQQYHAVVGNPPYIRASDPAQISLQRQRYDSCFRKFPMTVPFMERFFDLAVRKGGDCCSAGYVGKITSNSFMKQDFGKNIVEDFLPQLDLNCVVDTSGAALEGHGTSTVIVFGRNQTPSTSRVRMGLGRDGDRDTTKGKSGDVWQAVLAQIDVPGSDSLFLTVQDVERDTLNTHPWSLQGGGAVDVKSQLEQSCRTRLGKLSNSIGFLTIPGDDEVFLSALRESWCRLGIGNHDIATLRAGSHVRDFGYNGAKYAIFPYDANGVYSCAKTAMRHLWNHRPMLEVAPYFQKTKAQRGMQWDEFAVVMSSKFDGGFSIVFSNVEARNHFAIDRGRSIFNSHSPIIKLKNSSDLDQHLRLVGLLSSSACCFWMKQVFQGKPKGDGGAAHAAPEYQRFEYSGSKLKQFPVPKSAPLRIVQELDQLAQDLIEHAPDTLAGLDNFIPSALLEAARQVADISACMISLQEELDWQCYRHYGLIDADDKLEWPEDRLDELPPLSLGERAFEIHMARQMAEGELETTWFERHKEAGSKPITELPAHWPDDYRALVERRLAFIESNKNLNLIERPEYKRRWNTEPWAKRQQAALEKWLLTRLETYFHDADRMVSGEDEAATAAKLAHIRPLRAKFVGGTEPRLVSVRQLAQTAQADSQWMEAATVFAGRADFDVAKLVETLVLAESVPALPAQRYKPAGLRKREEWEKTWELQRQEDAVEAEVRSQGAGVSEEELKQKIRKAQLEEVGDIPVPPKYGDKDFLKSSYWRLRGKLDVPKERWVLYSGMEGGHDTSPVIAWAGWDHAQQAQALTGFYQQATDTWGWEPQKLAPLLAALKELLPWLHQWHNAIDPEYGDRISTTYQQFYETELHTLRLTDEDIETIRMGGGN